MRDGHIHTFFCPHGTKDSLSEYIEKACLLGFKEITFTEHAPLPETFIDPTPFKDSAMRMADIEKYFLALKQAKEEFSGQIKINAGLEVDFIEGFEAETKTFLTAFGKHLDDSILSVHFLKSPSGNYDCLDYSPDYFGKMVEKYGSVEAVHSLYYETVLKSVQADLGLYKPKRIGHITLVNKFKKKFPVKNSFISELTFLLKSIKEKGYEIDYNGAGTTKPLCREPYPPYDVARMAQNLNIPLVYGSDAHQAKELGQGLDSMIL